MASSMQEESAALPGEFVSGRHLVLAAHPDDEIIGLGSYLPVWKHRISVVHVTDGSPEDPHDAKAAGFANAGEYAEARHRESLEALQIAGLESRACLRLGFPDQGVSHRLVELTHRLIDLFETARPDVVSVHPYEGGHPDHDATSFAAAAAVKRMPPERRPRLVEFTSYHAGSAGLVTHSFLPKPFTPVRTKVLTKRDRQLKRSMYDAFRSQSHVLKYFGVDLERFRRAPQYDFHNPPHAGTLHYEHCDFKMNGSLWRSLAAEAESRLF